MYRPGSAGGDLPWRRLSASLPRSSLRPTPRTTLSRNSPCRLPSPSSAGSPPPLYSPVPASHPTPETSGPVVVCRSARGETSSRPHGYTRTSYYTTDTHRRNKDERDEGRRGTWNACFSHPLGDPSLDPRSCLGPTAHSPDSPFPQTSQLLPSASPPQLMAPVRGPAWIPHD